MIHSVWHNRSRIGYGRTSANPSSAVISKNRNFFVPAETSGPRRHRADAATTTSLPRPLRRLLGVGALVLVLGGSLSFAAAQAPDDSAADAAADASWDAVAGRENVWAQVSRSDGARVALEAGDPVTFTVTVDGRTLDLTSGASTLADALIDNGILVGLDDVVSAEMNAKPTDGQAVTISRVGMVYGSETTAIPFETVERETSALFRGTTRVETEGVEGSRVTTYVATYENGVEVGRVTQAEILPAAPAAEVVLVGTTSGSSSSTASSGSSEAAAAPVQTYSGGDPRAIAQSMVAARGWGADQWSCLDRLWQRESNWNPSAQNRSSGAYGIPQALPGSKMGTVAADWRTNPATQITWGLNYISSRYGTPCGAWGQSQSVGWY